MKDLLGVSQSGLLGRKVGRVRDLGGCERESSDTGGREDAC